MFLVNFFWCLVRYYFHKFVILLHFSSFTHLPTWCSFSALRSHLRYHPDNKLWNCSNWLHTSSRNFVNLCSSLESPIQNHARKPKSQKSNFKGESFCVGHQFNSFPVESLQSKPTSEINLSAGTSFYRLPNRFFEKSGQFCKRAFDSNSISLCLSADLVGTFSILIEVEL